LANKLIFDVRKILSKYVLMKSTCASFTLKTYEIKNFSEE